MKKADIQTHGTGYGGPRYPAINIKVYGSSNDVTLPLELGGVAEFAGAPIRPVMTDPEFTHEWIDEHLTQREQNGWWDEACRDNFEQAEAELERVFGDGLKAWGEGRSGGWLVVEGLPDVESWDAIFVGKWSRFEKHVKALVDDVPRAYLWLVNANVFEPWAEARDKAADDDAAALLPITVNAGDED